MIKDNQRYLNRLHVVVDAGDGADNHNDNNDADDDGNHDVSVSKGRGGMRQLPLV